VQQPNDRVGITSIGRIILRRQSWASRRGLSQQMADGGFIRPVASHQLLHDRLGQKLINCRLNR
jgi:hypothetical protein